MLKGNLTDLKLYLSADVQNTERLKMSDSALLFPNTDKIHVFPSCLQDVKSIVADLPPPFITQDILYSDANEEAEPVWTQGSPDEGLFPVLLT